MTARSVTVRITAHLVPVIAALAALASWSTVGDADLATTMALATAGLMMVATAHWRHGDVHGAGA